MGIRIEYRVMAEHHYHGITMIIINQLHAGLTYVATLVCNVVVAAVWGFER